MQQNLFSEEGRKIIFVGGSPRSGTTMVQRILGAHSDVFAGPEFDNIPYIVELRNWLYGSLESGRIKVFTDQKQIDMSICQLIESLLYPVIESNNCSYISEKTPSNILVFNELLTICPQAKFVFVLRDPRAIVLSMKEVNKRGSHFSGKKMKGFTASINESIMYILECFNAGFEAHKISPDRIYIAKYESIVQEQKIEIQKMCSFLNLPFEEEMLNLKEKSSANLSDLKADNIWYDTKMLDRNIESSELEKWKTVFSSSELFFINKIFRNNENLKKFHYNFDMQDVNMWSSFVGTFYYLKYKIHFFYKNYKILKKKRKQARQKITF